MAMRWLLGNEGAAPKLDYRFKAFKDSLQNEVLYIETLEYNISRSRFEPTAQFELVGKALPTGHAVPLHKHKFDASYLRPLRDPRERARMEDTALTERINHLFGFVDFLYQNKILQEDETIDSSITQRKIQKCAYIAQQLGIPFVYKFGFLGSGAFSIDMAIDLYKRRLVTKNQNPFDGKGVILQVFLDMVKGKSSDWLYVATFALREMDTILSSHDFVKYMERKNRRYGKKLAKAVFDHIQGLRSAAGQ